MNERVLYIEFIWPVPLEVQKKNLYPVTYNNHNHNHHTN